jgi:hypothetical protein
MLREKGDVIFMNRAAILQAIQELLGEMLALLPIAEEPTMAPTSLRLAGVFNNGKTPPTDEGGALWLEEQRRGE